MTTVIIDYKSGNVNSVLKSFEYISNFLEHEKVILTEDFDKIMNAKRLVLPGVGSFDSCKKSLFHNKELFKIIEKKVIGDRIPFLGICVGHQLLGDYGFENNTKTKGFGWIGGKIKLISPIDKNFKIPHMGWNEVKVEKKNHFLFNNIENNSHFYFTHSYNFELNDNKNLLASTDYCLKITAAIVKNNIVGTQFHPEKSQENGLKFIKNFILWNP